MSAREQRLRAAGLIATWLLAAAFLLLPWLGNGRPLGSETHARFMEVAILILIYVLLSTGLNIVVGFTGLLDLGYVTFMTVGAYTAVLLYRQPEWHFPGSFFLVLLMAGLHCAVWGGLRGLPTLHLTGDYYAIVTLAFAEILYLVILNEGWLTGGPSGIKEYPPITLAYQRDHPQRIKVALAVREDIPGIKGAELSFSPSEIWLGRPRDEASPSLKRRYEGGLRATAQDWGPRLRLRNFDAGTAFLTLSTSAPWISLRSGIVSGESPGSVEVMPPATRQPGAFLKPLVYFDLARLPPGRHEAEVVLQTQFGRAELKDGTRGFYLLVIGIASAGLLAAWRLSQSRLGRAWAAIKADETAARCCGVDVKRKKMIAFALSGFAGGVGGALMAYKFLIVSTNIFEFWLSIVVLCCVVLGGMGSVRGAAIGAVIFIGLGELLRQPILFREASENWRSWVRESEGWVGQILTVRQEGVELNLARTRYLFFGLILVLLMIFRPSGFLPPRAASRPLDPRRQRALLESSGDLYHLETPRGETSP